MLSRIPSHNLAAFAVWVPLLAGTYNDIADASTRITDPRVRHFWDQTDATGIAFHHTLQTPGVAWDVYLLYAPGIKWTGDLPPQPTYWMQQIGVSGVPHLDGPTLAKHVRALLAK